MLTDLFAKWLSELPGFVLVYLALFGLPRLGIHGALSSLWKLAGSVEGFRTEHKSDMIAVKESQGEIKAVVVRIEQKQDARDAVDGKSLHLNFK